MSEPMTATSHKAAALTAASALALYDAADNNPDKLRAAAAMAEVLRAKLPKPKAPKVAADLLTAQTLGIALKRLTMVIERKSAIPMLACVLLESAGGVLTLSGTDLDGLYVEKMRAPDLPGFKAAVRAHDLASAIVGGEGDVAFTPQGLDSCPSHLLLEVGAMKVRLPCYDPTDFPMTQAPDEKPASATMPARLLLDALGFVRPAISTEETRYYLNGAYMHVTSDGGRPVLAFVATDGSRLLKESIEEGHGFTLQMPGVILPRKAVDWILRNIRDDEVQVDVWPTAVRLTTVTGVYLTKVIDGNFPDYWRVIPRDAGKTVVTMPQPKEVAKVLARLKAQSKSKSASMMLTFGGGKLAANARDVDGGEMVADVPADCCGAMNELGFNSGYLAEMIASGDLVQMHLSGPNDPARLDWPGFPGRVGVLMPLRV